MGDSGLSGRSSEDHGLPTGRPSTCGSSTAALSVGFTSPLTGSTRSESIKHLSQEHPAFEKTRIVQQILVKVQTSLRRMPGVSSTESNEIIQELQEAGQIVSQETSQLVEALTNLTLDREEADNSIARMAIEINMAKAKIDKQTSELNSNGASINSLRNEVLFERNGRQRAETEVKKILGNLQDLAAECRSNHDNAEAQGESTALVKSLEIINQHLEDQVNNRRSLWVMKHSDPQSVARAMETLTVSIKDNDEPHRNSLVLRNNSPRDFKPIRVPADYSNGSNGPIYRPSTTFQAPPSGMFPPPPKFGPLTAGPPRAPSTMPQNRQYQDWTPTAAQNRPMSTGAALLSGATFSRPPQPPRRGGNPRYRPTAPDFQPSCNGWAENSAGRPGPSNGPGHVYNHGHGFGNAHGQGQPGYGQGFGHWQGSSYASNSDRNLTQYTPSSSGRSKSGNQYLNSPPSGPPSVPDYAGQARNRNANRVPAGPLIHLTDSLVGEWNGQVVEFYQVVRDCVDAHAHLPEFEFEFPQELTSTPVWRLMLDLYTPLSHQEASAYLEIHIRQENSKSCLVTRVIVDYVVNRVFTPAAWIGADPESDMAILKLQRDLQKSQGQTSAARQPLLDRQANIINGIMKSKTGPAFIRTKIEEIAGALLHNLEPLLNKSTQHTEAYNDLEHVAENAWELSSKILTSRLTFDFRFPAVGSRFSNQSMISVWPVIDPQIIQRMHYRVALVVTPVITCRNDTGTNISAHSVALADVFLMQ